MVYNVVVTLSIIFLAITLFSVPLILKYHVYRPKTEHIVVGDVVTVKGRLSSVWCQGVDLDCKNEFKSFMFDTEPEVDDIYVERTVSKHHIIMPNRDQEYWGFHLLRGSRVNISACARLITAYVTVVKGHSGLKKCLLEHRSKKHDSDDSGEDSPSESESDEDTSSISSSQGMVMNDTERPYICSNSIDSSVLATSYTCKHPFENVALEHALSQEIDETDYYFYIFSSNSYLDILNNEFSVEFSIDRTHYNYTTSTGNCSTGTQCELELSLGSEPRIVVAMGISNGTLKSEKLQIACQHRQSLFLLFYALFFAVIFFCAFQ